MIFEILDTKETQKTSACKILCRISGGNLLQHIVFLIQDTLYKNARVKLWDVPHTTRKFKIFYDEVLDTSTSDISVERDVCAVFFANRYPA